MLRQAVVLGLHLLASALVAFFGVAPAVFSDGSSSARLVLMAITVGLYALLGLSAGFFLRVWTWAMGLCVLPLLVLVLFAEGLGLAFGYFLAIVLAVAVGAAAGGQWGASGRRRA